MIPSIDEAKEQGFRFSTKDEMRDYCKIAGVEGVKPQHQEEALRKMLLKHFDITTDPANPAAQVIAKVKPKSRVTPEYNLYSEGVWGGRRWRGKVMKPQNALTKGDGGMYVFANGSYGGTKEGYPIEFGKMQVIPEPIYRRLQELEVTRAVEEKVPVVIDGVEHNNKVMAFQHDPMYHLDFQVEKSTEHLAGSMQEWYQRKEPHWYKELDLRDMQTVARALGLETHDWDDKGKRRSIPLSIEALRAEVFRFVYGYPEVELEAA